MSSVISATRSMIGELKWAPQDWAEVIPTISSSLNEASLERLGLGDHGNYRFPIEIMTGLSPKLPLLLIIAPGVDRSHNYRRTRHSNNLHHRYSNRVRLYS